MLSPAEHRPPLAVEDGADSGGGGSGATARKPGQRRNTRVVSHLEPERLQRKRQVDRKAQQALRERAKSRVRALEGEVAGLQQALEQRERQHVAQVAALQEQTTWLRDTLDRIAQLTRGRLEDVSTRPAPHSPASHGVPNPYHTPGQSSTAIMPSSGQEQGSLCISADHGATRERLDDHNLAIHESISDYQSAYQSDQGFGNRDHEQDAPHHGFPLSPPAPTLGAVQPYSASSSELGARDQIHPSMDGEETSSVLPSAQPIASLVPASTDTAMSPAFSRGPAETTCQHVPSTCILDSILVDFYRQQRKFVQEGAALLTVLGPSRPFVAAIVRPGSQSNHHPICRVIEDVMSTFGQIPAPEKLGIVFKMHATLRWLIDSSAENYEYMPRWLRPTATQITTPHAAWIDNIPWPAVRDMLIENPILYRFEVFSEVYSHTISVNWHHDVDDAVTRDEHTGHLVIAPIFEKHVRRLSNWTVSQEFEDYFPDLAKATKGS